jgi:hypothetical protein
MQHIPQEGESHRTLEKISKILADGSMAGNQKVLAISTCITEYLHVRASHCSRMLLAYCFPQHAPSFLMRSKRTTREHKPNAIMCVTR